MNVELQYIKGLSEGTFSGSSEVNPKAVAAPGSSRKFSDLFIKHSLTSTPYLKQQQLAERWFHPALCSRSTAPELLHAIAGHPSRTIFSFLRNSTSRNSNCSDDPSSSRDAFQRRTSAHLSRILSHRSFGRHIRIRCSLHSSCCGCKCFRRGHRHRIDFRSLVGGIPGFGKCCTCCKHSSACNSAHSGWDSLIDLVGSWGLVDTMVNPS